VVPIALCRSEGCGISTSENGGVKIEIEEDYGYRPVVSDVGSISNTRGVIANPSIGEVMAFSGKNSYVFWSII
jgi:hypothetical protein